jgi:hypothetical protein
VALLPAAGADIAALTCGGFNALHGAAEYGHVQAAQQLLAGGVLVDARSKAGSDSAALRNGEETALHFAARRGHVDMLQLLLSAGATVDIPNIQGATALAVAAQEGHTAVVTLLLKHGADPHAVVPSLYSPMFLAAQFNQPHAVALPLQAGAATAALNSSGFTALDTAAMQGHTQVVEQLLAAGVDAADTVVSVLQLALSKGQYAVSAQLQLYLYKTAQHAGLDLPAAFAAVYAALASQGEAFSRSAVTSALLQSWSAHTAAADTMRAGLLQQQQGADVVQAATRELLVLQRSARKAEAAAAMAQAAERAASCFETEIGVLASRLAQMTD